MKTRGTGFRAQLARARVGDVLWVETRGNALNGFSRTGRKITQEAYWAIGKQSGKLVTVVRAEVVT